MPEVEVFASHTCELLADGGLLILLEETSMQSFFSVTMGMQTGFDRFDDAPLRTDHPLLSTERWESAVLQAGFSRYVDFPDVMGIRPILIQA